MCTECDRLVNARPHTENPPSEILHQILNSDRGGKGPLVYKTSTQGLTPVNFVLGSPGHYLYITLVLYLVTTNFGDVKAPRNDSLVFDQIRSTIL